MDNIFMREEKKYIISGGQAAVLQKHLAQRMTVDRFGEYLVQNVYFDTDNFDIISESMDLSVENRCCRGSIIVLIGRRMR